ncbi:hypothetical protein [Lentibacillus persicus]|uniref:hypothetical protein n=1 Tax=Lentibacillus persicus TaxID=640948 RepID=UPI0015A58750|nr:hypothetical protein [Lentibacillus persicus]
MTAEIGKWIQNINSEYLFKNETDLCINPYFIIGDVRNETKWAPKLVENVNFGCQGG